MALAGYTVGVEFCDADTVKLVGSKVGADVTAHTTIAPLVTSHWLVAISGTGSDGVGFPLVTAHPDWA